MEGELIIGPQQPYKPLLCLNMIVKDEAPIIGQTLEKLVQNAPIDYWVICDTGSTDGTQDIIRNFFNEKGIQGELHEDEWINFGYNRTKALEYAFNKSNFLLVFDADDALNEKLIMPNENDDADGYSIRLMKGLNEYERILLIKNNEKWIFRGVVHEIIQCVSKQPYLKKLNTVVHVSTTGNRNTDPQKYLKDAALLERGFYEAKEKGDDIYIRYAFYCANSYYWGSNIEKAIEWYKKVLELPNWVQEKYMTCMELSNIYRAQNKIEESIFYLMKSHKYDNTRAECLTRLIEYYNGEQDYQMSYSFYRLIKDSFEKDYDNSLRFTNKLFVDTTSYYFFMPYSVIICSNHTGNHDTALKMFEVIFKMKAPIISHFHIRALFYNSTLYAKEINENPELLKLYNEYIEFLKGNNFKIEFDFMDRLKQLNIQL